MASALSELHSLTSTVGDAAGVTPGVANSATGAGTVGPSFAATLRSALDRLDSTVASADGLAKASAAGDHDIPLSDVMVSMEQANLAMQMAAGVRDKVAAAYTTIMNMPV
ncbi:MAG TPA: flagellar hook-basal body complex protein FliE [Stellaceae bacterium]|jgi:flagellar hook-basal body complex protein FliE|nr:flagellar hook-basal body complex protein FliE [Stellaceae bacterium]